MPVIRSCLLTTILVCTSFLPILFAQDAVLDSLKTAAKSRPDDKTLAAQVLLQSGIHYYKKGVFDTALSFLNSALRTANELNDKPLQIKANNNVGNVYADKGDNPMALQYYQQGLRIAEAANDRRNTAHLNKNIGALFMSWQRFDEAIQYYDLAEKTAIAIKDSSLIADCYNNKGTVYEQQLKYPQALTVYKLALAYYEKTGQLDRVAMVMTNIAIVYKALKDFSSSIAYNEKAMNISLQLGDKWMAAAILNNIGNTYGELGNYRQAIEYCKRSLDMARGIDAREIVISVYESMSSAAARAGDFKNAYAYHQQYTTQKDSFINAESTRQLSELQVQYQAQKKQRENEKLQYENKIRTASRDKAVHDKQLTIGIAMGSIVLLIVITVLLLRNVRIRAKAREEKGMHQALFEGEQKERIRIARDLHDSIGQKLAVVRIQLGNLIPPATGHQDKAFHQAMDLVSDTITEVRSISHNLIPEELNFGLAAALEELAAQTNSTGNIHVQIDIPDDARRLKIPQATELSVYRIVQEVMGNILKHANASEIRISLSAQPSELRLTIKDNGDGFDTGLISKSTGIGWKNIFARVRLINAAIDISSDKRSGTQVLITIPYE